ncbi:apolipoprotein N-acyltransferase [Marivita hallyeonensis]|uniref:Apolipoprotein N-acyltransferase n=1 Tax=Marivita hallyeonensis TaxID=996342 RepID=A0A1M5X5U7_9RHOB|nr:apolipoprotein N-acyltransferase [Marivita hallyeonensis]SHH94938.1 Apolipoprotein N-acyltransferase [Marivita hallyeonensis]
MVKVLPRLAAFGLGCLFALGQPPFDLWWVAVAALVAVFWLVDREAIAARAGWIGWLFGTGYFAISLHWILEPFQVDAAATGWMAPFALAGIAGGLSLFWAGAFWIGRRLSPTPFAIAVVWATVELARAYVLTGFPWGLLGYLWSSTPVAQWHTVLGPHGVTLITVLLAALTMTALKSNSLVRGLVTVAGFLALWIGGVLLTPHASDVDNRPVVRLIQPNAPQHQKWDPAHIPTFFTRQVDFTAQLPSPDLIVWPETAVPNLLHNAGPAFEVIADAAQGVPVVLGIQREEEGRYYNSLVTLDATGVPDQVYDKHHLVPFGEYMPAAGLFAKFNILGLAARAEAGYSSGPGPQTLDFGALGIALPLICYEAVFPQDVNGAPLRPDFLLHLTNDAWFGTSAGPQQHLQQARLRAIEQGVPLVRSANTGISAMIDPAGRMLEAIPLGRAGFVDVPLPAPRPPTIYSITGDTPAILALVAAFAALVAVKRRRPH